LVMPQELEAERGKDRWCGAEAGGMLSFSPKNNFPNDQALTWRRRHDYRR
jgi:hypothetical protein